MAAAAHGDSSRQWVLSAEWTGAMSARALLSSAALMPAFAQQPALVHRARVALRKTERDGQLHGHDQCNLAALKEERRAETAQQAA